MAILRVLSGLGAKSPACFLLIEGDKRILLDMGAEGGAPPGSVPEYVGLEGPVNAVVLSHAHHDHIGALAARKRFGDPTVYATAPVINEIRRTDRALAKACKELPPKGETSIEGIPVMTGRAGHGPGAIWVRFDIGENGFLYMGDYSFESPLWEFDLPPATDVVVTDATYGLDNVAQEDRVQALQPVFNGNQAIFPVPANGRACDIAVHFALSMRRPPLIDMAIRRALGDLLGDAAEYVRPNVTEFVHRTFSQADLFGDPEKVKPEDGVILVDGASLKAGDGAALVRRFASKPQPRIVLTGHVEPGSRAEDLLNSNRAEFFRWNVHPPAGANKALLNEIGAKRVMPAFGDVKCLEGWQEIFAPAIVTVEREMRF